MERKNGQRFEAECERISGELSKEWIYPAHKPINPVVLMLGGYQGSGKTSLLEVVSKEEGLICVSLDRIRHELFLSGYGVGDEFNQILDCVGRTLIFKVLGQGYSLAIDTNAKPSRIADMRKILSDRPDYRLVLVGLKADQTVLEARVNFRQPHLNTYNGIVDELRWSLGDKEQQPDFSSFDLVLDTEKLSLDGEVKKVRGILNDLKKTTT